MLNLAAIGIIAFALIVLLLLGIGLGAIIIGLANIIGDLACAA